MNNNYFVFRFRELANQTPMCKFLLWLPGAGQRIANIDIDQNETHLLLATLDGFITIIPLYVSAVVRVASVTDRPPPVYCQKSSICNAIRAHCGFGCRCHAARRAVFKAAEIWCVRVRALLPLTALAGEMSSFHLPSGGSNSLPAAAAAASGDRAPVVHLQLPLSNTMVSRAVWWSRQHIVLSTLDGHVKIFALSDGAEVVRAPVASLCLRNSRGTRAFFVCRQYSHKLRSPILDLCIVRSGAVECALLSLHNRCAVRVTRADAHRTDNSCCCFSSTARPTS